MCYTGGTDIASIHWTDRRGGIVDAVQLILVGGFLGAGKTTLLWEAARRLMKRGRRVGLITNDQAPDLVDTAVLTHEGLDVREVAGSCFCCNFNGLIDAAETLKHDVNADVLFAEPVGSCTDLSATILQPLKASFKQRFIPSPLSVLADPERLDDVLAGGRGGLTRGAAYIYGMQLAEADLIVINKADTLDSSERRAVERSTRERFGQAAVRLLSALTGEGVDEWLDEVLSGGPAGTHIAAVDYDVYAAGEAELGWLNGEIALAAAGEPPDGDVFCRDLLEVLRDEVARADGVIGHLKAALKTPRGACAGNVIRTDGDVSVRGRCGPIEDARLVLNARVAMSPEALERIVRQALDEAAGDALHVDIRDLRCFRPARPDPTHRYDRVV